MTQKATGSGYASDPVPHSLKHITRNQQPQKNIAATIAGILGRTAVVNQPQPPQNSSTTHNSNNNPTGSSTYNK